MDILPVKNPFEDITEEEVYEAAVSQGVIDRMFNDFKSCLKNSTSYKSLMEATRQTILGGEFHTTPKSDNVQNTKKQIKEIGLLANQFEASVSEFMSATIEVEGKPAIEKIVKQLAFSKRESASKAISSSNDENNPRTSKNIFEANEDTESVSSVHTSELSSLSDEVGAGTENHYSENHKSKIHSFKSYNKAYKSMVAEEKKKTPYEKSTKRKSVRSTSKACASVSKSSSVSKGASVSIGSAETVLPKRKRKPNSRYVS